MASQDDVVVSPSKKRTGRKFGHPVSEETRRKISLAKKGTRASPETEIKPGQRLSPKTEFTKGQIAHNALPIGTVRVYTGYRKIKTESGYVCEHIQKVEKALGQKLPYGVEIHHLDGDKLNNSGNNLLVCSAGYHQFLERAMAFLYKREVFGGLSRKEAIREMKSKFISGSIARLDKLRGVKTESVKVTCIACGGSFITGGKNNPPHGTLTCGRRTCKGQSMVRQGGHCRELSPVERKEAARIIDEMGSLVIVRRLDTIQVVMTVYINPDRAPIRRWLLEHLGIGNKNGTAWDVRASSLRTLLEQIYPHMEKKKEQAALALDTLQRLNDRALKADRSWQMARVDEMQRLNGRKGSGLQASMAF